MSNPTAMKYLLFFSLCICSTGYGQLTMDSAQATVSRYRLGYSSYFAPFLKHSGYGAPIILTRDGGAAAFGSNMLYKLDEQGEEQWMRSIKPDFDEMESQGVVEDTKGNLYLFMLSYDAKRYRGGSERVICFDKDGVMLWDKTLGAHTLENNPTVAYIRKLEDGRIYLRGHVVTDKPVKGSDPVYRYWEGWLDSTSKLTQKPGETIDWAQGEWQKRFAPE